MLSIKVDTGNTGIDIHTCRDGNDEIFALMYNLHDDEDTEKNKIPVAMQKRHLPASLEFSTTQKRLNEAIRRELIETLIWMRHRTPIRGKAADGSQRKQIFS